jgi:hypothetical protein
MAAKKKGESPTKPKKVAKGATPKKAAAPVKAKRASAPKAVRAEAASAAAKPKPRAAAKPKAAPKTGMAAKSPTPTRAATVKAGREPRPEGAVISVRGDEVDAEADPAATAKLAIGPGAEARETPTQIPWSYGVDRVTAAAIDPDRLFVYWEVTDPAIERARAALGKGGAGAWLNLRVYDTSGLIFDGTNAHSYFDHAIDRNTRQWFFHVGKPTSTAFVELGMRSSEGYFARIVRSARVDFPRREPAPWTDPEWMTVRTGVVEDVHRSPAPRRGGTGAGGGAPGPLPIDGEGYWSVREPGGVHEIVLRHLTEGGWEKVEWSESGGEGWFALEGRVEWESPRILTSWEAGPFAYPVEIEPPRREERAGHSFAYRVGSVTHVVEGPWRVVIRNVGAHSERHVVGTWEIHRAWTAMGGRVVRTGGRAGVGASEAAWMVGSEARMGGASERWRIGASELAWRGASERLLAGASQWRYGGASERAFAGGSELRFGGASERAWAGASEARLGGASESAMSGASEHAYPGASEANIGASEHRFEGPTAPPLPYPPTASDPIKKEG